MNPFLIIDNCCCASENSSFNATTDPASIAYVKGSPDQFKYRFSIPCSSLSQKTIKQKFITSGNLSMVVTEDANPTSGSVVRQTNRGRSDSSTQITTSFSEECRCLFPPSNQGFDALLELSGSYSGKYTYYYDDGYIGEDPYTGTISVSVNPLLFLCNGDELEVYTNWLQSANLTENPNEPPPNQPVTIPGLNSSGTVTLNILGQSTTVTLLNNWTPGWSYIPGFQGNYNMQAVINMEIQDCYE